MTGGEKPKISGDEYSRMLRRGGKDAAFDFYAASSSAKDRLDEMRDELEPKVDEAMDTAEQSIPPMDLSKLRQSISGDGSSKERPNSPRSGRERVGGGKSREGLKQDLDKKAVERYRALDKGPEDLDIDIDHTFEKDYPNLSSALLEAFGEDIKDAPKTFRVLRLLSEEMGARIDTLKVKKGDSISIEEGKITLDLEDDIEVVGEVEQSEHDAYVARYGKLADRIKDFEWNPMLLSAEYTSDEDGMTLSQALANAFGESDLKNPENSPKTFAVLFWTAKAIGKEMEDIRLNEGDSLKVAKGALEINSKDNAQSISLMAEDLTKNETSDDIESWGPEKVDRAFYERHKKAYFLLAMMSDGDFAEKSAPKFARALLPYAKERDPKLEGMSEGEVVAKLERGIASSEGFIGKKFDHSKLPDEVRNAEFTDEDFADAARLSMDSKRNPAILLKMAYFFFNDMSLSDSYINEGEANRLISEKIGAPKPEERLEKPEEKAKPLSDDLKASLAQMSQRLEDKANSGEKVLAKREKELLGEVTDMKEDGPRLGVFSDIDLIDDDYTRPNSRPRVAYDAYKMAYERYQKGRKNLLPKINSSIYGEEAKVDFRERFTSLESRMNEAHKTLEKEVRAYFEGERQDRITAKDRCVAEVAKRMLKYDFPKGFESRLADLPHSNMNQHFESFLGEFLRHPKLEVSAAFQALLKAQGSPTRIAKSRKEMLSRSRKVDESVRSQVAAATRNMDSAEQLDLYNYFVQLNNLNSFWGDSKEIIGLPSTAHKSLYDIELNRLRIERDASSDELKPDGDDDWEGEKVASN